ncbi:MAG: hypothetical protein ACI8WA_000686, partial [Polaribacter sp.]
MFTKKGLLVLLILAQCSFVVAQSKTRESQKRAIRQEIPLTNSIQKALKEGTRDFTGKPGKNYWQLETDYDIDVSLNPNTQILSGKETILVHNNSITELKSIVLRLDHNVFRSDVPRGYSVPAETTEGMLLTRLKINGEEVDLLERPLSWRDRRNAAPKNSISGLH